MQILMVCLGNICRSPLAEGILMDKIRKHKLDWQVDSAGTGNYQLGNQPHPLSQLVAKEKGIDISYQYARQLKKEDLDEFDKIYAMDIDNLHHILSFADGSYFPDKVDLIMNEAYPGENLDVPDPFFDSKEKFFEVFDMLEKACDAIINKYADLSTNK